MNIPDLSNMSDLVNQLGNAYSMGSDAMNKAGEEVSKDINPDHEIILSIIARYTSLLFIVTPGAINHFSNPFLHKNIFCMYFLMLTF